MPPCLLVSFIMIALKDERRGREGGRKNKKIK